MLAAAGWRVARRSRGDAIEAGTEIYLADTIGELGLFYSLAGIAFVGGSMTQKGGHNPFEAASLDCAMLHGPDMSNCAGMAAALAAAGASQTVTGRTSWRARSRPCSSTTGCARPAPPPAPARQPPAAMSSTP